MRLRVIDGATGAVLLESIVSLGGYAINGHVLLEFTDGASLHPVCVMHMDAGEADGFAAAIQAAGAAAYRVQNWRPS